MQGTFVVVEADPGSAVLRAVDTGQVVTLADNPGVDAGDVIEATVESDDTGIVYTASVEERHEIAVEAVDAPPADRVIAAAAGADPGDLEVIEGDRATVHVLPVPPDGTDAAVRDVVGDRATVERAARFGADRVEVRSTEGVVAVRYLSPDDGRGR